jgi:hypothetical protein
VQRFLTSDVIENMRKAGTLTGCRRCLPGTATGWWWSRQTADAERLSRATEKDF